MAQNNSKSRKQYKNRNNKKFDKKGRDTGFNTVPESGFNDQTKEGTNPKFRKGKGPTGKGRNPIELWNKHPDLTESAGSLAYSQALGQPYDWDKAGGVIVNATHASSAVVAAVDGVATLGLSLTYGTAQDQGSALNIAARNIYTYVRHLNSGHTNYDATNLMQYMIAVDQCYAMYAWLVRLYGTLLNYKVLNRYTPDDLLIAQGVDPSTFRANMAQFRFAIDAWAYRLQSFLVPSTVGVFKRHYDMFSEYYLDSENLQIAQVYIFRPDQLFYWDDAATTVDQHFKRSLDLRYSWQITSVDASHVGTMGSLNKPNLLTYSTLESIMTNMLQSIATTEDFNIMSGDILKAYGAGNTWTVPIVSTNYIAEPVFNWEMLVQIHNAHFCPSRRLDFKSGVTDATLEAWVKEYNDRTYRPTEIVDPITQTSHLVMDCYAIQDPASVFINGASILDVPFTTPTAQDNMEATRLKAIAGTIYRMDRLISSSKGITISKLRSFGTEVLTTFIVNRRSFKHTATGSDYVYSTLDVTMPNQIAMNLTSIYHTCSFTLFPLYYHIQADSTWTLESAASIPDLTFDPNDPTSGFEIAAVPTGSGSAGFVGEIDHSTLVSGQNVDNLHTAAILSAFDIPANATRG